MKSAITAIAKNGQNERQVGQVFSYMRWSSEPQTWGDSERRQFQQPLEWCQREGQVLAEEVFADRGVSG
jgi:hypothetical protein